MKKLNFYQKIDKSNMCQIILNFPKQFRIGTEAAKNIKTSVDHRQFSNIICGMGGSALPGDVFEMVNNDLLLTNLPILIHRNYGLPSSTNKNSLIICVSYSGNTEETISAFKEARRKKLFIVAIASGGKLIELAKKNNVPFAQISAGIQPRCSLGYQFSALMEILSSLKIIKSQRKNLLDLEKRLKPKNFEEKGKILAKKMTGSVPLVYSSEKYQYLARIWKIKFNENAKVPSFFNFFPELNHNEMTGIGECEIKSLKKIFKIIILEDKKDHPRVLKRMAVLTEIFKNNGVEIFPVEVKGKNIFEKVFNSSLLADWVSYYLAVFNGVDPTPIKLVEEFKKRMADK